MCSQEYLYHYTSLDALVMIIKNKSLRFNSLLDVDDMEEAETNDMGKFGKYVYVSCWTNDGIESVPMWNMYTRDMHGVRIKLPTYPFLKYHYHAGQYNFKQEADTYINYEKIYGENIAMIAPNEPKLVEVQYTEEEGLLYPQIKSYSVGTTKLQESKYSYGNLGKYKRKAWSFQKEWRYVLFAAPVGYNDFMKDGIKATKTLSNHFEDPNSPAPYNHFYLSLDEEKLAQIEIVFGPRMTEAEKTLARTFLDSNGYMGCYRDSQLRIK